MFNKPMPVSRGSNGTGIQGGVRLGRNRSGSSGLGGVGTVVREVYRSSLGEFKVTFKILTAVSAVILDKKPVSKI
jgi:hypothetical protein